ncbi:MAG: hypothetical protein IT442_17590 [Phycisphaeraceae bacterium]|nr:hypothetical protein [Phycisphaeraceae bacterium]
MRQRCCCAGEWIILTSYTHGGVFYCEGAFNSPGVGYIAIRRDLAPQLVPYVGYGVKILELAGVDQYGNPFPNMPYYDSGWVNGCARVLAVSNPLYALQVTPSRLILEEAVYPTCQSCVTSFPDQVTCTLNGCGAVEEEEAWSGFLTISGTFVIPRVNHGMFLPGEDYSALYGADIPFAYRLNYNGSDCIQGTLSFAIGLRTDADGLLVNAAYVGANGDSLYASYQGCLHDEGAEYATFDGRVFEHTYYPLFDPAATRYRLGQAIPNQNCRTYRECEEGWYPHTVRGTATIS